MGVAKSRTTEAMIQAKADQLENGAGVGRGVLRTAENACTLTNATNIVNDIGHGRSDNDRVKLAGTLPAELNNETYYYVISATSDTFQLSLTLGGAAVTFTTDGSSVTYSVVCANIPLNATTWGSPSSDATKSSISLNVSPNPTVTPAVAGIVTVIDWCDSDEVPYWSNTVSESGGGGECIINSATLSTSTDVEITSYTMTLAFT